MKAVRSVLCIVAAAALVPLSASAAFAAPPGNDTPDGAVALTLGQTVKEDTTQATTDKTDAQANRACGAPYTNASVWFSYAPSDDGSFILKTAKSDYSVGLMVFDGAPSARTLITCGPGTVAVDATGGTTYTIMAFSDTKVNGGNLVLSLQQGPPPPTVSVTIDKTGLVFKNGNAKLSGTFTCANAQYADLEGTLTQIWRRVKIDGYFSKFAKGMCDGQAHPWSKLVISDNGLYAPGKATVSIDTEACGQIDCDDVQSTKQVVLKQAT